MSSGTTIVIQEAENAQPRKIIKIVPMRAGGYMVMAPYHQAREGFLAKHPVDYSRVGRFEMPLTDFTSYTADDRVKLSVHKDGFVQFSGEDPGKIRSGRDPVTGEPKGLGIVANRLKDVITTGPTFGVVVWGIEDFEPYTGDGRDAMIFTEREMYYRNCTPDTWNGFVIESFVLSFRMWSGVRGPADDLRISMGFRGFEGSGANLDFRVIQLPDQPVFLALAVSRIRVDFDPPSGFMLNSQSDMKHALIAMYPRFDTSEMAAQDLTWRPTDGL
jgi:hypothetical protein